MYNPTAFRESDVDRLLAQISDCGLALLITHGSEGLQASHVPLLLKREGDQAVLQGHLAKANPQWHDLAAGTPALVVFSGPDAYVSPGFYPSKADNPSVVPTWNYISVQVRGTPFIFHDPEQLHAVVEALTQRHEAQRAEPWSISDAPPAYIQKMLTAIVGFSIAIEHIEGKRKLSQNRSAADVQGVRDALAASTHSSDRALASTMGADPIVQPTRDTP